MKQNEVGCELTKRINYMSF